MSKRDEYHAKDEYCREMVAKLVGPRDKEQWLQQAANWRTLASLSDRTAEPHKNQVEVIAEIWERLGAKLSKNQGN
jgi:hypothetical protein